MGDQAQHYIERTWKKQLEGYNIILVNVYVKQAHNILNQTLTHDEQPFPPSFPPFSFAFLDYPSYKFDISQPDFEIFKFLYLQSSVICADHTFDLRKLSSSSGFTLFNLLLVTAYMLLYKLPYYHDVKYVICFIEKSCSFYKPFHFFFFEYVTF